MEFSPDSKFNPANAYDITDYSDDDRKILRDILLKENRLSHSINSLAEFHYFGDLIKNHSKLTWLTLTIGDDSSEGMDYLAQSLAISTTLQSVCFRKYGSPEKMSRMKMGKIIEAIKNIDSLTTIDLSFEFNKGEEQYLPILLQKENLKKCLFCWCYAFGSEGGNYFPDNIQNNIAMALSTHPSLTSLELISLKTNDFKILGSILSRNTTLQSLALSDEISTEGMAHLCDGLKANSSLVEIRLSRDSMAESNQIFVDSLAHDQIKVRKVNMSGTNMDMDVVTALHGSLKTNSFLTDLQVGFCQLDEKQSQLICEGLIDHPNIESLNMASNTIDFLGIQALRKLLLKEKTKLKKLNLSDCQLTEECIHELADSLKHNESLIKLNLSRAYLTANTCQIMCDSLKKNKFLRNLVIKRPIIDIEGIKHIKEMLIHNDILIRVDFSFWPWTFSGFDLFCDGLKYNQQISKISLLLPPLDEPIQIERKFEEIFKHNYSLTQFETDEPSAELTQYLARNSKLKSEVAYKVAILSHNIARCQPALDLLPKELWIYILKQTRHPGMKPFDSLIDSIFKSCNSK